MTRFGAEARRLDPDWPKPIGPAGRHGLAGEVLDLLDGKTETDPAGILAQFLAAVGNAAGKSLWTKVEGTPHSGKFWPVIVGQSSKSRKGTSWDRVEELLGLAVPKFMDDHFQKGGLSSAEGLLAKLSSLDESDTGEGEKRLLVVEPEFANVLRQFRRDGNVLSPTLRNLWDGDRATVMTKKDPIRIVGAHLTIVAHITRRELEAELGEVQVSNGLANRFAYFVVRRTQKIPTAPPLDQKDLKQVEESIRKTIGWLENLRGIPYERTKDAETLWKEIYSEFSDGTSMVEEITNRDEGQVLRLSLIYAALDRATKIDLPHLEAAIEVWRYSEASAWNLYGGTGRHRDKILQTIAQSNLGVSKTTLYATVSNHVKRHQLDEILWDLKAEQLVTCHLEKTGGRPRELWILTPEGQDQLNAISPGRSEEREVRRAA